MSVLVLVCLLIVSIGKSAAQTSGGLSFTINPVSHSGSYGAKHLVAVWLESESGTFIKTKRLQCSSKNLDHLATWTSKSGKNTVDATTGATLTTYTPIAFVWNGTDVSGNVVADGTYKVWVEMAWDDSKTTDKTVTSYSFVKGAEPVTVTPANTNLFTDVSIIWAPSTTGVMNISEEKELAVFPNPTNGIVSVDIKSFSTGGVIQIVNASGSILEESAFGGGSLKHVVDLHKYANGTYFIRIRKDSHILAQSKVLLRK